MSAHRSGAIAAMVAVVGLGACAPVVSEAYRAGPEPITLAERPFPDFRESEELTARWLVYELRANPDGTLANPTRTFQDLAQLEWTANALREVYIHVKPYDLQSLLEARDAMRAALNVPTTATATEAILSYGNRARTLTDSDRRLIAERSGVLRTAMVKAGRSLDNYVDSLDSSRMLMEVGSKDSMMTLRRLFANVFWAGSALTLVAACGPVMSQKNMGPPEPISFYERPFNGFTEDEERAARWLAFDLMMNTERTLADPVHTLQDFSQLEWTANAMKGVYIHMRPTQLENLLGARDQIRNLMGLPQTATVSDAIQAYANRGRSLSDSDRRLLAERKDALRGPMVVAGRALNSYIQSLDDSQRRESEPPRRD